MVVIEELKEFLLEDKNLLWDFSDKHFEMFFEAIDRYLETKKICSNYQEII